MTIKDLIKSCSFYDLVESLSVDKALATRDPIENFRESYEDALFDILATTPSGRRGSIQSIVSSNGLQNFYICPDRGGKNLSVASVDWEDIVCAEVKINSLEITDELPEDIEADVAASIVKEMTVLGFSKSKVKEMLEKI